MQATPAVLTVAEQFETSDSARARRSEPTLTSGPSPAAASPAGAGGWLVGPGVVDPFRWVRPVHTSYLQVLNVCASLCSQAT